MDDEFQSSMFQSMIETVLLDVEKSNAEDRLNIIKQVDKLIEEIEANSAEVNKVYQEIYDEKMAISSKFQQLQKEKNLKYQEVEKVKNQNLILDEEKRILQKKFESFCGREGEKEEIKDLAVQVHTLKQEINSKKGSYTQQNLELMKGISFYKQYLQCNVFESDGFVVFSLDPSAHNMSQTQEYVRFKTGEECKTFQIVDYKPMVSDMEKLKEECEETGDYQCFIRNFRKEVFKLRKGECSSNNKENRNVNNKKQ